MRREVVLALAVAGGHAAKNEKLVLHHETLKIHTAQLHRFGCQCQTISIIQTFDFQLLNSKLFGRGLSSRAPVALIVILKVKVL
jgi:hypothetical protein